MLGEVLKPHEFDKQNLFERFLERSRASNVPMNFTQAERNVVRLVAPRLLVPDSTFQGVTPDYVEIGARLVQKVFPTPDLAWYALCYGKTVAAFKYYDHFNSEVQPIRDEYEDRKFQYNSFLERMAAHFNCSLDEAPIKALGRPITADAVSNYSGQVTALEPVMQQISTGEAAVKEHAKFAARTIMIQEAGWILPLTDRDLSIMEVIGVEPKLGPKPTTDDLQGVRKYMEDYFANEQHKERVTRFAQPIV